MSSRWKLRAAAEPERFLARGGFVRFLSEGGGERLPVAEAVELGVALPVDLARFLDALGGRTIDDFTGRPQVRPREREVAGLVAAARRGGAALVRLTALLAGAVPFGETRAGEVVVYFLEDAPARGLVAAIEERKGRLKSRLVCRGAADLAAICSLHASGEELEPIVFGISEEEALRALLERGRERAHALLGNDGRVRSATRALTLRPLDVPPPERGARGRGRARAGGGAGAGGGRAGPLAFGALVEAFFREDSSEVLPRLAAHRDSEDAVVRQIVVLLEAAALGGKIMPAARELARRRQVALRAARPRVSAAAEAAADPGQALKLTERIVAHFDGLPPNAESFAAIHEREETLLALADLGHHDVAPALLARAVTGDAGAVEMLAALGDRSLVPLVVPEGVPNALQPGLLRGEPSRVRLYEASVVRMVVAVGAKGEAKPALRGLLADNPLSNWREGLERGALVRELVVALGKLEDEASSPLVLAILESTSQEYRPILPYAAQALGRLRHAPALTGLERLLLSPKDVISCEAIWAVGAIGQADALAREQAAALLERLKGLEPGAEATRLAGLSKLRTGKAAPRSAEVRRAIDRALWEPAYRQEDTSRRRAWGLCALEELAVVARERGRGRSDSSSRLDPGAFFLGHEAIRHLLTRDDHRVRRAAESAFTAWDLPVPKVRPYYAFALPAIEERDGIEALIEAVRDPLGVFRHNVATRLAELGDPRGVRPLAEATARLFAEAPTSTYEYDDAPPHLVAFVRALARLNRPEGNDVLIEGLRSDNHQVRAVVAENAPDDERFVPELMAMLGDPRSFLRSRAEKSLTSLGALQAAAPVDTGTKEVAPARRLEV